MEQDWILLIDRSSKGASNNVLAIAQTVAERVAGTQIETVQIKIRNKMLIPFLYLFLNPAARHVLGREPMRRGLARLFFRGTVPPDRPYKAVISALGSGEAPGAFIGYYYRAPCLHLSSPRRMPRRFFSLCIANPGMPARKGDLVLPMPPTRISPAHLSRAAAPFVERLAPPHQFATLLIGGLAGLVHYDQQFWQGLYRFITHYHQQTGQRWLISTAPRTPPEVVEALTRLAAADEHAIADLAVFTGQPGEVSRLPEHLGAGSAIFVTAESVSMLGDALATGKPVVALTMPGAIHNARINGFLAQQQAQNHLYLHDLKTELTAEIIQFMQRVQARPHWSDFFHQQLDRKSIQPRTVPTAQS